MKIAVISDVHSNIEALEAVLQDIENKNCEKILCTGDLVGYGANPKEVIKKIKEMNIQSIMGNYDEAVGFLLPTCGCHIDNPEKKRLTNNSLNWTIDNTSSECREFLRALPEELELTIEDKKIIMVHGTIDSVNQYIYENDIEEINDIINNMEQHIYIYGHTHFPFIKEVNGKFIINAGSVGRPKNGDNRASYVIIDITNDKVSGSIERIPYNIEKATIKIIDSGLDNYFADFLRNGGKLQEDTSVVVGGSYSYEPRI